MHQTYIHNIIYDIRYERIICDIIHHDEYIGQYKYNS